MLSCVFTQGSGARSAGVDEASRVLFHEAAILLAIHNKREVQRQ